MNRRYETAMQKDDDFRREVGDVKPLPEANTVRLIKRDLSPEAVHLRRLLAQKDKSRDPNYLTTEPPVLVDPYDELSYRKPGIQQGVFKALKQGHYEWRYVLDLHRRTVDQARDDVFYFIQDAIKQNERCVMILHGRGKQSNPPALLKSYCNHWLRHIDDVLAFHSAQARDGGTGALYLMLKKSEQLSEENREKFGG